MPLARIIATSAKYSDGLADDLRSRGFQVLTSAPGENVSESADLEITLNECLADEARVAGDTAGGKDMRVFLTPQAFAGNIRSIEMFVLTPKRVEVEKSEVAMPFEAKAERSSPLPTMLELAAPAEVVPHDRGRPAEASKDAADAAFEGRSDRFEEMPAPAFEVAEEIAPIAAPVEPQGGSGIGRSILASRQSAWPDMAEMKLVPAELAAAPVRSAGEALQVPIPPERIPVASSHSRADSDKRFWRVPIVAGIAAVLAMSAVWLANHVSTSHPSPGTAPSVEAAGPGTTEPAASPRLAGTAPSPAAKEHPPSARKLRPSHAIKAHTKAPAAKRRDNPDDDYVAKDTTIFYSRQPTRPSGTKTSQARP